MPTQYVRVLYPDTRPVEVDDAACGETNQVLMIEEGTHRFTLGGDVPYIPPFIEQVITGTTPAMPMLLEFLPKISEAAPAAGVASTVAAVAAGVAVAAAGVAVVAAGVASAAASNSEPAVTVPEASDTTKE